MALVRFSDPLMILRMALPTSVVGRPGPLQGCPNSPNAKEQQEGPSEGDGTPGKEDPLDALEDHLRCLNLATTRLS